MFSSPLWGFFYLICIETAVKHFSVHMVLVPSLGILLFNSGLNSIGIILKFSSPLWGFFYLIIFLYILVAVSPFSSPLWGFFYLMASTSTSIFVIASVLVPSLGILLFNPFTVMLSVERSLVLVPSLGILLFNKIKTKQ